MTAGLVERPLVIGLFWSLFTGETELAMGVSVFFELFWLDAIPAGTYIPPLLGASTFAALALTSWFGLTTPSQALLPILLAMPLAFLGVRVEGWLRHWHNRHYNRLLNWSRSGADGEAPEGLVLRSVAGNLLACWAFGVVSMLALAVVLAGVLRILPGAWLSALELSWPMLWLSASLGGLLALRLRRAYALLAVGCAVAMFAVLAQAW